MKKMKTVLAVVAALAVMATAMTGFAATVSTVTEYHMNTVYAGVTTTVTGATGDVTLLVTTTGNKGVNESGILYIDQKTATTGSDLVFDYSVVKANINNLETEVLLGTTGASIEQSDDGLGIVALSDIDTATYTVDFAWDAYAAGDDSISASITAKEGFEITKIIIGGEERTLQTGQMVDHEDLDDIVVETRATVQTPALNTSEIEIEELTDGKYQATAIIKIDGSLDGYQTGVKYNGEYAQALGNLNDNGYIAVRIIDAVEITEDALEVYFQAE